MDALTIFFTVGSIVTIALAAYGAIKMNRRYLLLGTFLCAAIVSFPNKISYSSENQAAVKLAQKIGLSIMLLNILQGYIVLQLRTDVPDLYGYAHFALALIFIYMILKSRSADFKMK